MKLKKPKIRELLMINAFVIFVALILPLSLITPIDISVLLNSNFFIYGLVGILVGLISINILYLKGRK